MNGAGWLWIVVDVIGVAILAGGIIYGTMMWRRRRKDYAAKHHQEEVVRDNYRRGG